MHVYRLSASLRSRASNVSAIPLSFSCDVEKRLWAMGGVVWEGHESSTLSLLSASRMSINQVSLFYQKSDRASERSGYVFFCLAIRVLEGSPQFSQKHIHTASTSPCLFDMAVSAVQASAAQEARADRLRPACRRTHSSLMRD